MSDPSDLMDPGTLADAIRQIATAIGTPADVDPLSDLSGLVLAVQGVAQRAESRDIRLAAAEDLLARVGSDVLAEVER